MAGKSWAGAPCGRQPGLEDTLRLGGAFWGHGPGGQTWVSEAAHGRDPVRTHLRGGVTPPCQWHILLFSMTPSTQSR